jgi:hypothetical protein
MQILVIKEEGLIHDIWYENGKTALALGQSADLINDGIWSSAYSAKIYNISNPKLFVIWECLKILNESSNRNI